MTNAKFTRLVREAFKENRQATAHVEASCPTLGCVVVRLRFRLREENLADDEVLPLPVCPVCQQPLNTSEMWIRPGEAGL